MGKSFGVHRSAFTVQRSASPAPKFERLTNGERQTMNGER